MENVLFPFFGEMYGEMANWMYPQDGASIFRSRFTRFWLSTKGVRTIGWPAKSLISI